MYVGVVCNIHKTGIISDGKSSTIYYNALHGRFSQKI